MVRTLCRALRSVTRHWDPWRPLISHYLLVNRCLGRARRSYQYSTSPKLWNVLPCSLRYSKIVELTEAVEMALKSRGSASGSVVCGSSGEPTSHLQERSRCHRHPGNGDAKTRFRLCNLNWRLRWDSGVLTTSICSAGPGLVPGASEDGDGSLDPAMVLKASSFIESS